ncbi:hypothetical protein [Kordia zhangzhouensis]|uniref:hypothetical protein n=1 Tax=Kordia zhangzhouensis TaxID=1620405 RepID=UPI0006294A51|nr:hypothetical protein [Kordia zhangzhouensis]
MKRKSIKYFMSEINLENDALIKQTVLGGGLWDDFIEWLKSRGAPRDGEPGEPGEPGETGSA